MSILLRDKHVYYVLKVLQAVKELYGTQMCLGPAQGAAGRGCEMLGLI